DVAADAGGDDGQAAGHGLQERQGDALGARGQDEQAGPWQQGRHVADGAEEADVSAQGEVVCQPLRVGAAGAVTGDLEAEVGAAGRGQGGRLQEGGDVLFRGQAGDGEGGAGRVGPGEGEAGGVDAVPQGPHAAGRHAVADGVAGAVAG